jgi:hypothetical protein
MILVFARFFKAQHPKRDSEVHDSSGKVSNSTASFMCKCKRMASITSSYIGFYSPAIVEL